MLKGHAVRDSVTSCFALCIGPRNGTGSIIVGLAFAGGPLQGDVWRNVGRPGSAPGPYVAAMITIVVGE